MKSTKLTAEDAPSHHTVLDLSNSLLWDVMTGKSIFLCSAFWWTHLPFGAGTQVYQARLLGECGRKCFATSPVFFLAFIGFLSHRNHITRF